MRQIYEPFYRYVFYRNKIVCLSFMDYFHYQIKAIHSAEHKSDFIFVILCCCK